MALFCVPADHYEHRCRSHSTSGSLVHLCEQTLLQAPGRVLACARVPCPEVNRSDRFSKSVTADHHEDPGLAVLGARGMGRRLEQSADHLVADGIGREAPARPLTEHHLEECVCP
jgi:hypothetical protein